MRDERDRKAWICLWLLTILFFVRGLAYICLLPPGEMWDESSHLACVDNWVEHGHPAIFGQAFVDPQFLQARLKLPQPIGARFGRSYSSFWASDSPPPRNAPRSVPLYESQHPFLYYALAAPVYRICRGRSNLPAAYSALRLVNVILGTAAFGVILWWLGAKIGGSNAVLLGAWVTLQPLVLLDIARVANDALAFFLGTIVLVLIFDFHRSGIGWRSLLLALLLPVAILSKVTDAALIPVVLFSLAIACSRGLPVRTAIRSGLFILCGTLLFLAPYLSFNLHTYGLMFPMAEAVTNRSAGRSSLMIWKSVPIAQWPVWAMSWWIINGLWVGGWSFLWPPRILQALYGLLLTAAGIATAKRWNSLKICRQLNWSIVWVVVCVQVTMMAHAAESYTAVGHAMTNSWYAAVAIPWLLILLGSGSLAIKTGWLRSMVTVGMPALFVVTELYGMFRLMLPTYYAAPAFTTICMERMASIHPAIYSPTMFILCVLLSLCLLSSIVFLLAKMLSLESSGQSLAFRNPSGPER